MRIPVDPDDRVARLYILDFGLFKVHAGNRLIGICGYLVQTVNGRNILIDTGFPAKYAQNAHDASREDNLGSFGEVVRLGPENLPAGQLRLLGLSLDDVDCLVLTHTHIDHVGGIAEFPHAPLIIGREERACRRPLYWKGAQPLEWPDVETILIGGDTELCKGLRLLATPGHSPGHLSVLLHLPRSGAILLTADAISRPAEIEERFAGSWNEALAIESAERILSLAQDVGAQVIYGHWPEQWPGLKKAPQSYD